MGAYQYMGEATTLKAEKLYSEMLEGRTNVQRANLIHTWHKFLQFLEDDMRGLARTRERVHSIQEILK